MAAGTGHLLFMPLGLILHFYISSLENKTMFYLCDLSSY